MRQQGVHVVAVLLVLHGCDAASVGTPYYRGGPPSNAANSTSVLIAPYALQQPAYAPRGRALATSCTPSTANGYWTGTPPALTQCGNFYWSGSQVRYRGCVSGIAGLRTACTWQLCGKPVLRTTGQYAILYHFTCMRLSILTTRWTCRAAPCLSTSPSAGPSGAILGMPSMAAITGYAMEPKRAVTTPT